MKDNEIMKAMECCSKNKSCRDCPYIDEADGRKWCNEKVYDGVISIINRQQAEIERLTNYIVSELSVLPKKVKTETINDFVERLKEGLKKECSPMVYAHLAELVDNLVTEMTEGNENALKERERV